MTGLFDGRDVDKDVFPAALRLNEAVPFCPLGLHEGSECVPPFERAAPPAPSPQSEGVTPRCANGAAGCISPGSIRRRWAFAKCGFTAVAPAASGCWTFSHKVIGKQSPSLPLCARMA
jgi:hypothetical protein